MANDGLILTLLLAAIFLSRRDSGPKPSGPKPKPEGTPPMIPGWEPDLPVRQAVADRAAQLLPLLWETGEGSSSNELVDGREVLFIAEYHGAKKGITAYRRIEVTSSTSAAWTDQDMQTFIDYLSPLGIPLDASLLVYTAESGLNPKAHSSAAWGIPQLTARTMKSLGWSRPASDFGTLTVSEQIPWIAKLQASQISVIGYVPKDALELYVANFSPVAAKNRSEKIYLEGTKEYEANRGLDRDHKGWIAPSDLRRALDRAKNETVYKTAIAQLERLQA